MQTTGLGELPPQDFPKLCDELKRAGSRQLTKIFIKRTREEDKQEFPTLALILLTLHRGIWPAEPSEALMAMIESAILSLPSTEYPDDGAISWREFGLRLYGFMDDTEAKSNGRPHDYKSRFKVVKEKFTVEEGAVYDRAAGLRSLIAEQLIKKYHNSFLHPSFQRRPRDPAFIRRELEYSILNRMIDEGQRVITLLGEGGTGKSTLAKNYAEDRGPMRPYIFADFRSDDDLVVSLDKSFAALGISTAGLSRDTALLRLREWLAKPIGGAEILILDNIEDGRQIERLGPLPESIIVIITGRSHYVVPNGAATVDVGSMTKEEVTAYVKRKLPSITNDELAFLDKLSGRILAIEAVCNYLAISAPAERPDFLASIQKRPVWAIGAAAGVLGGPYLQEIYEQIVTRLARRNETKASIQLLAIEIASHVVGLHGSTYPFFYDYMEKRGRKEHALQEYRIAIQVLARNKLSTGDWDQSHYWFGPSIHPLTEDFLREILKIDVARFSLEMIARERVHRDPLLELNSYRTIVDREMERLDKLEWLSWFRDAISRIKLLNVETDIDQRLDTELEAAIKVAQAEGPTRAEKIQIRLERSGVRPPSPGPWFPGDN